MKKETLKAKLKATNTIVEVIDVGDNLYLDTSNNEVYKKNELDFINDGNDKTFRVLSPDEFLKMMKAVFGDNERQKKEEIFEMLLSFEMEVTLEILRKRPFISPKRLDHRVCSIMKNLMNVMKKQP